MKINWWSNDFLKVAQLCKEKFPKEVAEVIIQADKVCENNFIFSAKWEMERTHEDVVFKNKILWHQKPYDDEEWIFAFNRLTCVNSLAQSYLYTKDEKYAVHFVRILNDWIDNSPLTDENKKTSWRTIEAGLRCENLLKAYLCFKDSKTFTADDKDKFMTCMSVHGEYLDSVDDEFRVLSNWGILQNHGLFLLGVFFNNKNYITTSLSRIEKELNIQVFNDGSHWEQSPMYHCEVLHCSLDVVMIALRNGIEISSDILKQVHNMLTALSRWVKPNGNLITQSDSDEINASDLISQGAFIFNDENLKFFANNELDYENLWNLGTEIIKEYEEIKAVAPANPSYLLNDSGNYMLRDSLKDNSNFLHFHCGCLGSGHGHADMLHIDIAANGEDILIDSGRYTYVNNDIRKDLKSPASHNTTTVDNVNFSECFDSWGYSKIAEPLKSECHINDEYEYISGGHMGYIDLKKGGVFTRRKVVYIKPDIYIICDEFYANNSHSYQQFFNFNNVGKVILEDNQIKYTGLKSKATLINLTQNSNSTIYDHQISKTYNQLLDSKSVKIDVEGDSFTSLLTVISTSNIADSNEVISEKIPLKLVSANKLLTQYQAEAIKIVKNGVEFVVVICHNEIISQVDLIQADEYKGYGKIIVFTKDNPAGKCLAW